MEINQLAYVLYFRRYLKLVFFTLVATIVIDFLRLLSVVKEISIEYSMYISALLMFLSIAFVFLVALKTARFNNIPYSIKFLFLFWLLWNIFNIIRGGVLAKTYWDWKFLMLSSLGFSLISILYFIGNNSLFSRKIFEFYLKYVFTLGFLTIPLTLIANPELYSRLMVPVSIFVLLLPFLKSKWRPLIIIVVFASILMAVGFRANILKIMISFSLLGLFYVGAFKNEYFIRIIHYILFLAPIALLVLALSGSYNILSDISAQKKYLLTDKQGKKQNLTSDSRSFLYLEVLQSTKGAGNWIIGKSASGSYNSKYFFNNGGALEGKRYRTEVNILNILIYHGMIGVIIYFLLLFSVSYQAIKNSRNALSKMFGIMIASRWALSFVEEFSQFDLNFYFFWLIVGLASSLFFRNLTDDQVKRYFCIG